MLLLASFGASAAEQPVAEAAELERALDGLRSPLLLGTLDDAQLSAAIRSASALRSRATLCANSAESKLAAARSSLQAVGPEQAGEQGAIQRKLGAGYRELQADVARLESMAGDCRLLSQRADELVADLTGRQQARLLARLAERGPDAREVVLRALAESDELLRAMVSLATDFSELSDLGLRRLGLLAITIFGVAALAHLGARRLVRLAARREGDTLVAGLRSSVAGVLVHFLPLLGVLVGAAGYLWLLYGDARPLPFHLVALQAAIGYLIALVLIRGILRPYPPLRQLTPLDDAQARALARRLVALSLLGALWWVLRSASVDERLPSSSSLLARTIVVALVAGNGIWLVALVGKLSQVARSGRGLRLVLTLVMLAVIVSEILGYRNLSWFVLGGVLGSLAAVAGYWLVSTVLREALDGLDAGTNVWHQKIRTGLALDPDESVPGLLWIRLVVTILLWVGMAAALLRVWGLTDTGSALLFEYLVDGFTVGGLQVVPSKVLLGLLIFALVLAVSRWVRDNLDRQVAARTRLEPGAREALVTITGYVGAVIAILVGISLAGFSLQNLAIIAGALSLGIGFGLQNVVNNFVSGLIMLFERPVRPGDWVVVGGTEGYVKRISVRATEIQTFDRSDVIVPNSEFISNQVTNWTLRDAFGRLTARVGVAYGSDTDKVRELLLQVAREHPQVVQHGLVSPPKVVFREFGDSSLNFELRCFVRDINLRLDVLSDLNFAIDRCFRANGIDIPFPQRDLHLRRSNADLQWPPAPSSEPL
jgi:small-conductance mechanosensitive channel